MSHSHSHGHGDHVEGHGKSKFQISRKTRLQAVIAISFAFFIAEIGIGFYTQSLALVADAFHYFNDLISFIIALIAVYKTESKSAPPASLSYGWSRASLLGAFFNGVFLLALGLSIFLQSIERFISIETVEQPKLILIVGCVGLALNLISATFLHEHGHDHGHSHGHSHSHSHASETSDTHTSPTPLAPSPIHAAHLHTTLSIKPSGMDFGIAGVLLHVCGDVINNIGVIITALIIWFTHSPQRYYADPAVSLFIAIMIFASAIPLTKRAGNILLQSAPPGIELDHVRRDLESIPGVQGVHELHVWQLDQRKTVATAHLVVEEADLESFMQKRKILSECLHAYGIHSATLQPELTSEGRRSVETVGGSSDTHRWEKCELTCGTLCEPLKCCI